MLGTDPGAKTTPDGYTLVLVATAHVLNPGLMAKLPYDAIKGCYPDYLPTLIAAAEAVATPKFHLQAIQAATNPAAVWLIINRPIAKRLEVNVSIIVAGGARSHSEFVPVSAHTQSVTREAG